MCGFHSSCKPCVRRMKVISRDRKTTPPSALDCCKTCSTCKATKRIDEFHRNICMKDGFRSECKPCSKPKGKRGSLAKNWCFTLNNYAPSDLDRSSSPTDGALHIAFGKGVDTSSTPHSKEIVCFATKKRVPAVKEIIGEEAHCTTTQPLAQSADNCKKGGGIIKWGVPPYETQRPGRRTNLLLSVKGLSKDKK